MRRIRACAFILALIVLFAGNIYAEAAQGDSGPIIINVDAGDVKPLLNIVPGTSIPVLYAGDTVTLTLPVKNSSTHDAKNITVTLDSGGKSDFPFVYDELGLAKKVDKIISNQTVNVVFELDVDQYATEGRHVIKLNYSYSNIMGNDYTSSELISVKIINNNAPPKLTVSNIAFSTEKVIPGQKVNANFKLKNLGTLEAKDIKITLNGLKNEGFTIDNFTDTKYLSEIKGQSEAYVIYTLVPSKNITGGTHTLELKMEYKDNKNKAYTEVSQVFIPVTGKAEEGKASLMFEEIQYPVNSLEPGSDFPLSFKITNNGNGKAQNIKIWLTTDKEIISKSLSTIAIDTLDKGQTKKVEFKLSAVSDAATKNYPVAINMEYDETRDDKVQKNNLTQYIGIYIENNTVGKSVPKIIVSKYSFEPVQVKAGENFRLKLHFLNTNRSIPTSNIKISLSSDDGTFQPVNSSNTFYIEGIAPKAVVGKEITFSTKPDVTAKPYILTVNYEYEDDKGNPYTAKDVISIPVLQVLRLVTGEVAVSSEAFAGQPVPVTAEFFNMGKSTLYNLMIKAEGDFQVQGSGYFVGNFEPGKSDVFDTTLIPNKVGGAKGNIVFSFEDASGKQTIIKKEFTMNIMEMPKQPGIDGEIPGVPPAAESGKKGVKPIYLIAGGAGAAIIILILIIVLRKKIKARKELTLDE
ncbi:MAG: hypothetical protein N3I35_09930 [Clostridia bacterium]|nr:hypothetical protein [Clostridia bacterium]